MTRGIEKPRVLILHENEDIVRLLGISLGYRGFSTLIFDRRGGLPGRDARIQLPPAAAHIISMTAFNIIEPPTTHNILRFRQNNLRDLTSPMVVTSSQQMRNGNFVQSIDTATRFIAMPFDMQIMEQAIIDLSSSHQIERSA
jgi:hypothetical protein